MRSFLLILMIFVVFASASIADEITLNPTQDVGIFEMFPNSNYSGETYAWVGYDDDWDPPGFAHTLIQFDVSPYAGATINSATLKLFFYGGWGGMAPGGCFVGRTSDVWSEGSVTWNTRPEYNDSHVIAEAPQYFYWWNIDITDYVASWVDGSHQNYGVEVGCTGTSHGGINFRSKEFSNPDFHPELDLDYSGSGINAASLGNIKASFK